jgi:protein ImuB
VLTTTRGELAQATWTSLGVSSTSPGLPEERHGRGRARGRSGATQQLSLSLKGEAPKETFVEIGAASPLPRALVRGEAGGARIVAVDGHARRLGVRVATTLAEARARAPSLATAIVDPLRVEILRASIVDAMLAVSPRVGSGWDHLASAHDVDAAEIDASFEDHVFFVELEGPGDVETLAVVVRELDLGPAAIGVADGAFAAACAARIVEPRNGAPRVRAVPRGDDARFLAPLPSALLPAAPYARAAIAALGLHTMALVAALPMEGVHARLGEEGRTLVSLARGASLPAVATFVPNDEPAVEVQLSDGSDDDGAVTLDAILFALRTACRRLVPPLTARGEGLGEVEVLLEPKPRTRARAKPVPPTRIVVRPARAEVDPTALFELARATIEGAMRAQAAIDDADPPPPFVRLTLTATTLVPITHAGESLAFARREATVLPLDVALARLRGRFGTDRVVTPVRHEDPRPDGRGVFRSANVGNVEAHIDDAERARLAASIDLRERLRAPSPAIGAVILSRAPVPGDAWPIRDGFVSSGASGQRLGAAPRPRRTVEEVTPAERVASGWWDEPYALVYRWVVSNDGMRALFARGDEKGGWKLVGLAD